MADFIPQGIVKFNVWQGDLMVILEHKVVLKNINKDDYLSLYASPVIWIDAFAKADNRKNRTNGDVRTRLDARIIQSCCGSLSHNGWPITQM